MQNHRSPLTTIAGIAVGAVLVLAGLPAVAEDWADADPSQVVKRYDTDGDGKLGKTEQEAARAGMRELAVKRHDTDGDGKLSEEEKSKAITARRLQLFDLNKDGKIDEAERTAGKAKRESQAKEQLAKYDTNGNGRLDPEERAEARSQGVFLGRSRQGPHPGARQGAPAPKD